ncbi:hypothetical protein ACHAXA_009760 [Cyclostephanos tholiformis]|uniref:Glycosyltransferase family 8 protein n=1 Tax=Cyclostephanos tholiformis TaxID=382380 RepID=A0ABD3SGH8_9STRA
MTIIISSMRSTMMMMIRRASCAYDANDNTNLHGRRDNKNGRRKCRASTVCRLLALSSLLLTLAPYYYVATFIPVGTDDATTAATAAASIVSPPPSRVVARVGSSSRPTSSSRRPRATIAYAISLTSCGNDGGGGHSSDASLMEGAAVLRHSIHLSSIRNYEISRSVFDYEMIAFVHPDALPCSDAFRALGYDVRVRDTPFNVSDIRGKFLRENIIKSGCCGEREYLKLYSYTLLGYPVVVHLDMDSLILRPLDDLFLAMLDDDDDDENGGDGGGGADGTGKDMAERHVDGGGPRSRISVMFDAPLPPSSSINSYFTRDYNMINPGHKHVGVQGGFLVVRPSMEAFDEYVSIVLEGRFVKGNGWYGEYGGYFGAQQIQGICSLYYDYKHPGTGVELNRCYYNAMADAPRETRRGRCRDGREECQDCRDTPIGEIKSVHFTLCSKPWKCPILKSSNGRGGGGDGGTRDICAEFHSEWFRIREDLDRTRAMEGGGGVYANPGGDYMPEIFRGYCNGPHERGYIPIGVAGPRG